MELQDGFHWGTKRAVSTVGGAFLGCTQVQSLVCGEIFGRCQSKIHIAREIHDWIYTQFCSHFKTAVLAPTRIRPWHWGKEQTNSRTDLSQNKGEKG